MSRPMTQRELARALDLSESMVSRLVRRGMPTDCVERAKRWRRRHIEPGRAKGTRYDPKAAPKESTPAPAPAPKLPALGAADTLMHFNEARYFVFPPGSTLASSETVQALDAFGRRFLALLVNHVGGVQAVALYWWQWLELLPPEYADHEEQLLELFEALPTDLGHNLMAVTAFLSVAQTALPAITWELLEASLFTSPDIFSQTLEGPEWEQLIAEVSRS